MSAYENVVGGKLKLKGKALDVKAAGINKKTHHHKKKKKKLKHRLDDDDDDDDHDNDHVSPPDDTSLSAAGGSRELISDSGKDEVDDDDASRSTQVNAAAHWDDHLTPAERRYMEQREKIDTQKMAKTSNKSHRDRIEDFNQYLANMSEHYDIPKVGPG